MTDSWSCSVASAIIASPHGRLCRSAPLPFLPRTYQRRPTVSSAHSVTTTATARPGGDSRALRPPSRRFPVRGGTPPCTAPTASGCSDSCRAGFAPAGTQRLSTPHGNERAIRRQRGDARLRRFKHLQESDSRGEHSEDELQRRAAACPSRSACPPSVCSFRLSETGSLRLSLAGLPRAALKRQRAKVRFISIRAPCNTRASHYWEGCHARRTGFDPGLLASPRRRCSCPGQDPRAMRCER